MRKLGCSISATIRTWKLFPILNCSPKHACWKPNLASLTWLWSLNSKKLNRAFSTSSRKDQIPNELRSSRSLRQLAAEQFYHPLEGTCDRGRRQPGRIGGTVLFSRGVLRNCRFGGFAVSR